MTPFICEIPKAELHMHIEGSLEPELMFEIAGRNGKSLPYGSVDELKQAYNFDNLQSFLDIYYQGAGVLMHENDFYDMTWDYLKKAAEQNIRHTEIFFDPQTHTERGVPFDTVIYGITRALSDAKRELSVSSGLIMCFLRHLRVENAMETLNQSLEFKSLITAVGLDSSEVGFPPDLFIPVFEKALKEGFLTVAHAGEEGPADYIWQAIKHLNVSRIDHGVRCEDDPALVEKLVAEKIPLTVCPLSNQKLNVYPDLSRHNLKSLLDKGVCVTVNSDDPAYFGGYLCENLAAVQTALGLDRNDIYSLMKNAFNASFISLQQKEVLIKELDDFMK